MFKTNCFFAFILFTSCGLLASCAEAQTFSIEDRDLSALNERIGATVRVDKSYESFDEIKCTLVGKKIGLSHGNAVHFYALTTADACGWGGSIGPIWIVRQWRENNRVVFYGGGYSFNILRSLKPVADLEFDSEHAGRISSVRYIYDGSRYVVKP